MLQFLKDRFGYEYGLRWLVAGMLVAFILLFRGASIWALHRLNFQNR